MKTESKNAQSLHRQRQFSYKRIEEYHRKYIDKKTGRFAEKYMVERPCPVCGSSDYAMLFQKSGGTYVRCRQCTMIYTNPVFTESALQEYYTNLDTGQAEIVTQESDFYREIYSTGLKAIMKYRKTGKILDVGCSSGFFLDIACENDWETAGIELGAIEAEMCRKKGHRLYTQPLEDIHFNEKFDAITLWDVFEHIVNGKAYLNQLSGIISEQGVIFIQIPNAGGLAPRIMQSDCKMFDGVEHVNLYNPKTIRMAAEQSGFEVVYLETVISELAVLTNYLNYQDPYFGKEKYDCTILGILTEKEIHQHKLGYKMQVVLKLKT